MTRKLKLSRNNGGSAVLIGYDLDNKNHDK